MKRIKVISMSILLVLVALACVCCSGKKEETMDYSDYVGKEYTGEDPWGNLLSVTLKSMEDNQVTFDYVLSLGDALDMNLFVTESTGELKDGVIPFHITATAEENESLHFDYTGSMTLKDGSLFVIYDDGQVNEESSEGGSAGYQAQALEGDDKTVELKAK